MNKYRVGLRWQDGEEKYIVITSSSQPSELAENLKSRDKTGKLDVVYIKKLN